MRKLNYLKVLMVVLNLCAFQLAFTQRFSVTGTGSMVSCYGASDGEVHITVVADTLPITYLWSDVNKTRTKDLLGVPAGTYSVIVTSGGQSIKSNFTVTEPDPLTVDLDAYNFCLGCMGRPNVGNIISTVNGGNGNYNYQWSLTNVLTPDLIGVPAGSYALTVTDDKGCTTSSSTTLPPFDAQFIQLNNDADVQISFIGGNPPYAYRFYEIDDNNVRAPILFDEINASGQTYSTDRGVTSNSLDRVENLKYDSTIINNEYHIYIKDANCNIIHHWDVFASGNNGGPGGGGGGKKKFIKEIIEREGGCLADDGIRPGVTDFGDPLGGTAIIVTSGGTPPYTYTWSNGATTDTLTGLYQGVYVVTVTDSMGLTLIDSAVITYADSIPPNAICIDDTFQLDSNGLLTLLPQDLDGGSSDQCRGVDLGNEVYPFSCANSGLNMVNLVVADSSGNMDTCTANIYIGPCPTKVPINSNTVLILLSLLIILFGVYQINRSFS